MRLICGALQIRSVPEEVGRFCRRTRVVPLLEEGSGDVYDEFDRDVRAFLVRRLRAQQPRCLIALWRCADLLRGLGYECRDVRRLTSDMTTRRAVDDGSYAIDATPRPTDWLIPQGRRTSTAVFSRGSSASSAAGASSAARATRAQAVWKSTTE